MSRRPPGSGSKQPDLEVERSVPKFLKQYTHLLRPADSARPAPVCDASDEDEPDAEAVQRALDDAPDKAAEFDPTTLNSTKAAAEKERGNALFKAKDFAGAIEAYTAAINLDNTQAALYSNRSAARAALKDWEGAHEDAIKCVNVRPAWFKGWVRLGAAHAGQEGWSDAKDAYARAMELEPDDKTIQNAFNKADYEERQASQSGRVVFRKRRCATGDHGGPSSATAPASKAARGPARRPVVSYDDGSESDGG